MPGIEERARDTPVRHGRGSGIQYSNGRPQSETKLSMVFVSVGPRHSNRVGKTCGSLGWLDADLHVTSACSDVLDSDEQLFLEFLASVRTCDLLVLKVHGNPSAFVKFDRVLAVVEKFSTPMFLDSQYDEIMEVYRPMFPFDDGTYDLLHRYVKLAGEKNTVSMLLWFCSFFGNIDIDFAEPHVTPSQGIYLPGIRNVDERSYLRSLPRDRPTVGIMFNQIYWNSGDLRHIDDLINTLQSKGANTIPVFFISAEDRESGCLGIAKTINKYMVYRRKPVVDCIIMASGFAQTSMGGMTDSKGRNYNCFETLDVPILQAGYVMRSPSEWREDPSGMSSDEVAISIIQTEFDGQIFAGPLGFVTDSRNGTKRFGTVRDRVERIADLALAWTRLRKTPRQSVRIAIVLNSDAQSADMVGKASGLDTFESLRRLLNALGKAGYDTGDVPSTTRGLVDRVMSGLGNDLDWVSPSDIPRLAADLVEKPVYSKWLFGKPDAVRMQVCNDWGDPPGNVATYNCRIIIPGVFFGNVYVGTEPACGDPNEHGKKSVPHQYLAFYSWIRNVFGADCVIHLGTHGTLEQLPGKSVALSSECFPHAVMDAIPHIYPYIISNPGEGSLAKRRTSSVIVDHNCPDMMKSGLYGDLQDLDGMLQTLMNLRSTGQTGKIPDLLRAIRAKVDGLSLWKEIGLTEDCDDVSLLSVADRTYDYLTRIKDRMIADGLHVLGSVPTHGKLDRTLYALTYQRNGSVPSLREAVASSMGLDLDALEADPSGRSGGEINGRLLERIDEEAELTVARFREFGFDTERCLKLAVNDDMRAVTRFICDDLVHRVHGNTDEISNIIRAVSGCYVPPGPSGTPERGNASILPTGRNFYSINPSSIPTVQSWKAGKLACDAIIQRFVDDTGRYPENIGMAVWASDVMNTGGDDISCILNMIGVRPVWDRGMEHVTGLEVIPLSELGRPRIDMTLRISDIFRDTFPNLLGMLDDAFQSVSDLDESEELNKIRKHMLRDFKEKILSGMSERSARSRSLIRLFGAPPNRYYMAPEHRPGMPSWGPTSEMVSSYTDWSSHAYGRSWHGEEMRPDYVSRMGSVDLTVKNMSDRCFDILDSRKVIYSVGGISRSAQEIGGKRPPTYITDMWDGNRPRVHSLEEETAILFRSKICNPRWLKGLKQHGFNGAMELSDMTDCLLGWSIFCGNVEDWMFDSVVRILISDEDTRDWLMDVNPYAMRNIIENLMDAADRNLWKTSEGMRVVLRDAYLECEGVLEESGAPD